MHFSRVLVISLSGTALAFPGLRRRAAAPYKAPYTYTGAANGLPGSQSGGQQVPASGDSAHAFTPPSSGDQRGPCPGLNAAANHNFLSHDGIVTFTELVDAQQNLYNVGYDLAVVLATLGVALDGDIVTGKLSLGTDATSKTALLGNALLGVEPGLAGHNKFEGDTSLTRNDYFLANGDDYTFNGTLFGYMQDACNGNFDFNCLAQYRYERYQQSLADNGQFYFSTRSLLLYGAASFLYELFPNYGPDGKPDLATIGSFFGAVKSGNGWSHVPEQIPANWHSRKAPYTLTDVTEQILTMYLAHPVLFGGNTGKGNFNALNLGNIKDGKLQAPTANDIACLIYQMATDSVPGTVSGVLNLPTQILQFTTGKLNPIFKNYGCPLKLIQ